MGWVEIPKGPLIVAMETGPSTEVADPFPNAVVTLLTEFYLVIETFLLQVQKNLQLNSKTLILLFPESEIKSWLLVESK